MDRIKRKHLNREQFQELLEILDTHAPDHPVTDWVKHAFCMNDGDSTITASSLAGHTILQWHLSEFDEEDEYNYDCWFGDGDDNWDFD
jgi:hypothetical protein